MTDTLPGDGRRPHGRGHLQAVIIAAWLAAGPAAFAQVPATAPSPSPAPDAATAPVAAPKTDAAGKAPGKPVRSLPARFSGRAGQFYKQIWGVDSLSVKRVESGEIIRFAWRVVDPARALPLHDKDVAPTLEDPRAGVSLVVPQVENIGMLRQTQTPEAGKSYWMAFSNRGRQVKQGDRVNVVIGQFRADGLVVD